MTLLRVYLPLQVLLKSISLVIEFVFLQEQFIIARSLLEGVLVRIQLTEVFFKHASMSAIYFTFLHSSYI